MKQVELYAKVRYAVQIEGISRREAARRFGIAPRTVTKMLWVNPHGWLASLWALFFAYQTRSRPRQNLPWPTWTSGI